MRLLNHEEAGGDGGGYQLNLIAESGIMAKTACTVPITQIILDEEIYPRSSVYPKRVSIAGMAALATTERSKILSRDAPDPAARTFDSSKPASR